MKSKLTDRQTEIAISVRELAKTPENDSWGDFVDFTRAVATMIEGVEALIHPSEMQTRFSQAWQAYANLWGTEHNRIIRDCLGSDEEFERIKAHPNGRNVIGRILSRVKEVHGDITPGMAVNVDVADILFDELGETA